jgi:DNA modification methylase
VINLMHGDCLEMIKLIPDGSVDMVLTDPPYGTTACKWDTVIPLEAMWAELKRVIKPNGAIVLFGSQPFTSILICSNLKQHKYNWVWDKKKPGAIGIAKYQPLRYTEDIIVFCKKTNNYNPQMVKRDKPKTSRNYSHSDINKKSLGAMSENKTYTEKYPSNIIQVSNANQKGKVHPTQKPLALMEYLIRTYTNEGETVLDFTMGSGTTGVACVNTGRKFIGIELDQGYFDIATQRINQSLEAGL